MKKYIFLFALMLVGLSSCYQSKLDPLQGIFPAPTVVENFSSASCTYEKVDGKRLFTLHLSDGETALDAVLVGESYCLTSNAYTEATASAAKKGNYILGQTKINGQAVKTGTITVEQTPIDEIHNSYTLKAVLFLEDGTPYRLGWAGNFDFEPEAEGVAYFFEDVAAPLDADPGVTKHTLTFHNASDNEVSAVFELLLATGNNEIAGTYTCAEYASAAGQMGNGYNFPDWGVSGGSYYLKDGERVDIAAGETLTVSKVDGVYVFKGSTGYELQAGVLLTQFGNLTDYSGFGMQMVGVELLSAGITATPGGWGMTYAGDGQYLKLELYSADGTVAPGSYKACAVGGTIGAGEFGIGYDGAYGASGTTWYSVTAGTASGAYVTDGELTVEKAGANYTLTLASSLINARYVGSLSAE
ncbi:MAG: hypothetical protein K6E35_02315 [Bacteroidales bacterium]|nr:hypothetical protein [Bacteroidales bacterium]